MKRPLASALAFLIVALSPGAPAYQAFAQTVGRTGTSAGATGDAATSVNAGPGAGLSVPLAIPAQSLGLNATLTPAGAPSVNVALSPAAALAVGGAVSAAPMAAPAASPAGAAAVPLSAPAAADGGSARAAVPGALQPAKSAATPGAPASAAKQVDALSAQARPVLEGVKNGDASLALNGVYENSSARGALGSVSVPQAASSLRSGLRRSVPSAESKSKTEVPSAAEPAAQAPVEAPAAKPGLLQRARAMFDLTGFTKSEKSYILGQAVFLLGVSVYLASLPLLVKAITGDAAMTGVARMVHYWVFGGASLFAGAVVGKNPMKRILVGAGAGRAVLFGAVGVLAMFGSLPWGGFLVLVGLSSLLAAHNHLVDADTGGAARIFKGADQKSTDQKIEKAGYVYDFIFYGMMLVVPALIGIPMDWLDARFGAGIGAGAGFATFAALMGVVSYIYAKHVVVIGDIVSAPLAGVRDFVSRAIGAVKTFGRILVDVPRRNWATAKLIFNNKAIMARSLMATTENFVEDALFAVVLPTFAIDILGAGAFGNGLLLSAITGGGLVASLFLMKRIQGLQAKYGTYKVLAGLSAVAALAFVPSIGLWLVPSIALAVPAVFMMKLMLQPLRSRMRALLQTEIKNDPNAAPHAADIFSLMTFVEVLAAGAGGLAFAWLFHHSLPGTALALTLGAMAPMKIITLALVGMGFVYLGGLRWVKAQLNKAPPTLVSHKSPEGNEQKMLERLTVSLKANGLPAYKTKLISGPADDSRPTVGILAPSSLHKVATVREGGKLSPGDVHLILDSSWLVQEVYADGTTKMLVRKGVVFDEKGQATVVEYENPRRERYFADFFTLGANNRDDGVPFEKNSAVPQSNSVELEAVTNDKLLTRKLMAAAGIAVPQTLAMVLPKNTERRSLGTVGAKGFEMTSVAMPGAEESYSRRLSASIQEYIEAARFPEGEDKKEQVAFRVTAYGPGFVGRKTEKIVTNRSFPLYSYAYELFTDPAMTADGGIVIEAVGALPGAAPSLQVPVGKAPWLGGKKTPLRSILDGFLKNYDRRELVGKPSGPAFHSGYGVRFLQYDQNADVYSHALALAGSPYMTQDGVVLADARVQSAPLYRDGRKMETTLRVLASRTPWDGYMTSGVFGRVGPWGKPTTAEALDPRDNATVEPWHKLLAEWRAAGYLDARSERELDERVRALGPTAFAVIDANEKTRKRKSGEPYKAQTDLIGLDVMIELQVDAEGKPTLVPVVIEVNDHDSGGQYNLDQMQPEITGEHSRLWMATALQRARRDALEGKRILLVGAGYEGKRPIFVRAKELGVKVVLAGPRTDFVKSLIKDKLVDEYIEADNTDVKEARDVIRKKLQRSARKNGKLDGLTTFWEDDVELTALLAEDLELPYHSPNAARSARSKFETQKILKAAGVAAARHEIVDNLSTASDAAARAALVAKFRETARQVGFPAVLKPVSGAAAIGTEKVNSLEEAVNAYERISAMINPKTDPIFALNSDLLLMQYLDGQKEYDVDLVMVAGEPVFESIADNKPTREPSFLATGSRLPSTLSAKEQREAVDQAIAAAKALGLTDGVLHMEGKYTSEGARLIEANARMGGTYVHEWVKAVWGVDLAEEGLMAAARVGGKPFKPAQPLVHLDGDFFNSDKPGVLKAIEVPDEVRAMPGFIRFRATKHVGDRISLEENGGYARIGMIEAGGATAEEAHRNLEAIKAKIRVVIE